MAEGGAGGFAAVYPVLKAMEEAGRVRRGYFVAGLGGRSSRCRARSIACAPCASPAPRTCRSAVVLPATDPANPYGAALPWPEPAGRAQRAAGAHVVLVDGAARRVS